MSASAKRTAQPPERLTVLTCIGCGAMSVPGQCAGGCGPERKLELVAASELDALIELDHAAERRCGALADVLTSFLALPSEQLPDGLRCLARAALAEHEQSSAAATRALAAEEEPVVSWWCEECGGLDAPAPCLGVCLRRPAQWASADAVARQRASFTARLEEERRLASAVRAVAYTSPRPGAKERHWQRLRERATSAVAGARLMADARAGRDVELE
jgi:hypothetical protein